MPRKSLKGDATATDATTSSPAVKTPKTPKTASTTPATKDAKAAAAATPTPASGTKPRRPREKKPAASAAPTDARTAYLHFALAQALSIAVATGGQFALGEVTGRELAALRGERDVLRDLGVQIGWRL